VFDLSDLDLNGHTARSNPLDFLAIAMKTILPLLDFERNLKTESIQLRVGIPMKEKRVEMCASVKGR